jgi:DNA-binding NarL/FixJ family response regulator
VATPVRLLIVDDESIVRESFARFFDLEPGFEVVGEASDGREAITAYERELPDVVLMDLKMPGMSGVEAMAEITGTHPEARLIAVTTFTTMDFVVPALRAGASGYLVKDCTADELLAGIHQVLADEMPLSPAITKALARSVIEQAPGPDAPAGIPAAGSPAPARAPRRHIPSLTPREHDVLELLSRGLSNKAMADELCISTAAVKAHLRHVGEKLGVRSRTQILVLACQLGMVSLPSPEEDADGR